ncbi:polysaccharide pyruvyl transferase family protein [Sulfitobacter sp. AS92]|uniref:polysaccharide pyruvyl transferase family protein n=1 Tax=Sulfitobacter sp. AS92 TaxID=3135783 RepID=UPI00316CF69D
MSLDAAHTPLRLHWWKAQPNFGDALSPLILSHVSGRRVVHASVDDADVFALGSLLQLVRRNFDKPREAGKPMIWGSGLLRPPGGRGFLKNVEVALLRGPITAALLGIETDAFGDPGLLVNEVLPAEGARTDKIGIVPHHTLADDPKLLELVASDSAYVLIDPRSPAEVVCPAIASCAHVFASSLHGLITADAYGVANTWVAPEGQGRLKFHDYAASVGRAMRAPIALTEIASASKPDAALTYQDGIDACRTALVDHFPAALCARQGAA